MRTFYDDVLENNFKTDSEGRTVFFAKGLTKPGYILPNEEKKNEIKKIISIYSSILLIIILVNFFIDSLIFLLFFLLLHFGWYRRKINNVVKELQVSDLKPKLDPLNIRIGIGLIGIIVVAIVLSGVWLIPIFVHSRGIKGIIISISVIFSIFTAAFIGLYFLMVRKKQDKNT